MDDMKVYFVVDSDYKQIGNVFDNKASACNFARELISSGLSRVDVICSRVIQDNISTFYASNHLFYEVGSKYSPTSKGVVSSHLISQVVQDFIDSDDYQITIRKYGC